MSVRYFWLIALATGCSRVPISTDPSPEDYCRARDEARARAFPEEAKVNPAMAINSSCPKIVAKERTAEPDFWKRRVRCMREHIRTDQEAKEANAAYSAMTNCESGGPQPVSK